MEAADISSYGGQDATPGLGFEVTNGGQEITLTGNVWKLTNLTADGSPYTVTDKSILRFDFTLLNDSGEIVGIGLENSNSFRDDDQQLYQLAGSQNFSGRADTSLRGDAPAVGETVTYEIALADLAGQSFTSLVFINDDDNDAQSQVSFANITLVEPSGSVDPTDPPQIAGGALPDISVNEDQLFERAIPIFDNGTATEDLVFSATGLPDFATIVDGVLTGTGTNADVGDYQITLTATDEDGESVTDTFALTVENVNDAPVATSPDLGQTEVVIGQPFSVDLPAGAFVDEDADDTLTYSSPDLPDGVSIDPVTGMLTGSIGVKGDFDITIVATDSAGEADETIITLAVDNAPIEPVIIEAEQFTALINGDAPVENFFRGFAGPASDNFVIRVGAGETGSISTDLDAVGTVAGFYDLTVDYFDETDGESTLSVLIDRGDGNGPELLGTINFDRTDLPGQGNATQAGNLTTFTIPSVNVTAGSRLILEGTADRGEVLRVDRVLLEPVDNAAPEFSSLGAQSAAENQLAAAQVTAVDPEGSDVTYAIAGGSDAALFTIDAATGLVSFLTAPDFEVPSDSDGDNVYDVTVEATDGVIAVTQDVQVTVTDGDEGPTITSAATVVADENQLVATTVTATDPENAPLLFALAGTGADDAFFAIDAQTGELAFLAAPDFEVPADADLDGVYDVSVSVSDGTTSVESTIAVTVADANDAPVAEAAPADQAGVLDTALSIPLDGLFTDQDAGQTLTFSLVSGAPAGVTLDAAGLLTGTPTEAGVFDVVIAASDGIADPVEATFTLNIAEEIGPFGPVNPSQDLDGDGTPNATDPDVDGDTVVNFNDSFAYDAENGVLLGEGESIDLTFDIDGTPYQNGITGLLQGGVAGSGALTSFNEETGTASVSNGKLLITASNGDTGASNTPEDDYQVGVKNGSFLLESRVDNPFLTSPAANFDQLGIHVGVDSTDFVKLVFGFANGVIEFSSRTNDVEAKATGGNQPLPAGLTLAGFSAVDLSLNVNSASATTATISGSATFLDAAGDPIAGATNVSL
ncbi:MAG: putative Ig domain-containing protein, partial [Pseudomonadota bacterium]